MNYSIRELLISEKAILDTFLYHAIYIPEGVDLPPFDIIYQPDLQVYVKDFGEKKGDICFVAECEGKIIGAVWVRIMNDYGHVYDDMPSLAISLLPEYRNNGIGTALMKKMLSSLRELGYKGVSLSVQKENYACSMYKKLGFKTIKRKTKSILWYILCRKTVSSLILRSSFAVPPYQTR